MSQVDLGAELIHGDATSLYLLAVEKGWEMEELISLAQGDGGPLPAESNDGFGLFYVGSEKRMLGIDSKVQNATFWAASSFSTAVLTSAYALLDDNDTGVRCFCEKRRMLPAVVCEIGGVKSVKTRVGAGVVVHHR